MRTTGTGRGLKASVNTLAACSPLIEFLFEAQAALKLTILQL